MIASTEKRKEAFKLRIKGRSYNEINKELGIPKSTLSGWFRDLVLSKKAQKRLNGRIKEGSIHLIKRNKMQTHLARKRAREIQSDSKKEVKNLTKYELLLVGVALYWGEGYKRLVVKNGKEITSHKISFSNTDPKMVHLFVRFLTETLHIPRYMIKTRMRLYEHINEKTALTFWSKATCLPKGNFQTTSYAVSISSKRKRPYNRLPYGTLCIEVADTKKFHRVLGMIEGMKNKC